MTKTRARALGLSVVLALVIGAVVRSAVGGAGPATTAETARGPAVAVDAAGEGAAAGVRPTPVIGDTVPAAEPGAVAAPAAGVLDGERGPEDAHPADRAQTTLLAAAGQAVGPGVSQPAAGVSAGDQAPPVNPDDVLSATAARGGCALDYGDPGQCLPARPPSASTTGAWTCAEVRQLFPDGLSARDGDPLHLDPDGDGVACGPGD